ncbi:MAG: ferritin-like domain-containing protein [Kofleriaceae bacterium]
MATSVPTREQLVHGLYEAAELEHNLMCTYLYAAFSLRQGTNEGLSEAEAAATARWRKTIIDVAVDEMGHLAAVWNITSALGAAPRFGRLNFPLDPGVLPASIVVKLAPFGDAVIQHFIHLERPNDSEEPEGPGFTQEFMFRRGNPAQDRLVPMAMDYDTVGVFYATLEERLRTFAATLGDDGAFCGDPELQLGPTEVDLNGAKPVICVKTALKALDAIVTQGEGAPGHSEDSHFSKFTAVRAEYEALKKANPAFSPSWPSATNPVLRPPVKSTGRVWIEDEEAARTVDVANAAYALMLRMLAYTYALPRGPEKGAVVGFAIELMRAVTLLGERAARLPAGPSNPHCNAGMSFTALRDASPLNVGAAGRRFIMERFDELVAGVRLLDQSDERAAKATRMLTDFSARVKKTFANLVTLPRVDANPVAQKVEPKKMSDDIKRAPNGAPIPETIDGVDHIPAEHMTLLFDTKKCIHSRHCVTGAPDVFLANVEGPWIIPDASDPDYLAGIAHMCPSGAIRYQRTDGHADEPVPPVNLVATREAGPYAVRGEIHLDGGPANYYRLTLCRCGASKNKPFCDSSHKAINFAATGEPKTFDGKTDMLAVRNGPLAIDPQTDGPLQVRGNLEITSGTGRVVARVQSAKLCRCGGSNTKPFCDGTHAKIGFRSDR